MDQFIIRVAKNGVEIMREINVEWVRTCCRPGLNLHYQHGCVHTCVLFPWFFWSGPQKNTIFIPGLLRVHTAIFLHQAKIHNTNLRHKIHNMTEQLLLHIFCDRTYNCVKELNQCHEICPLHKCRSSARCQFQCLYQIIMGFGSFSCLKSMLCSYFM